MSTATASAPAPAPAPVATRGISPLRSSAIFIRRSLLLSVRDGEALLMSIALPVMSMLLFTIVFGGAIDPSGDYTAYIVPGVILICAGFGASSTAVSVSRDMTTGAMMRYRSMPVAGSTAIVGHVVASVVRNLLATSIVIGVAFAIGFRTSADLLGWLGALGIVTLWILAVTCLFAFIGLLSRSPESANGYGFIFLFLPYLSSAFVPIDTLPHWIRGFATYQPASPVIETIRANLVGGSGEGPAAIAWCVGIIVVTAALAAWRFPRTRVR